MPVEVRIQSRRGTAADWTSANPVLFDGEPGYEKDSGKLKIGDGVTAWNALPYFAGSPTATGYTHVQGSAASVWTINHNLGRKVDVTLYTTGGVEMLADITHTSANQAVVNFASAVAGSALAN